MITIDKESKQRARLAIDIDNMCDRFKTANDRFVVPSPSLWTIDKNYFYLLRNSTQKSFNPKYKMRPDYMSFDEYGTVSLADLLMYINGIFAAEDFDLVTVIVPSFTSIVDICKDKFSEQDVGDLSEVTW